MRYDGLVLSSRPGRGAILSKRFRFEAAHSLPDHLGPDGEEGKCARLHGHSYLLDVSIRGAIKEEPGQSDTGMVMDFATLTGVVKRAILDRLDHQNINDVLEERSTAEHLAHWCWERLVEEGVPELLLYQIKLWETEKNAVAITHAEREAGE